MLSVTVANGFAIKENVFMFSMKQMFSFHHFAFIAILVLARMLIKQIDIMGYWNTMWPYLSAMKLILRSFLGSETLIYHYITYLVFAIFLFLTNSFRIC